MMHLLRKYHLHETTFVFCFFSIIICSYRRELLNKVIVHYVELNLKFPNIIYANKIQNVERLSNLLFYAQIVCFCIVTFYVFLFIIKQLRFNRNDITEL